MSAHKRPRANFRQYLLRRLDNLRGFATGWGRTYGDICVRSLQIHDQMTTNAATFTAPPVTMVQLLTDIQALQASYALSQKGARSSATDTLVRQAAAETVVNDLAALGSYVAAVARTSGGSTASQMAVLSLSGFPLIKSGRINLASPWVNHPIPGIPQNIRQMPINRDSMGSGVYRLRWQKVKGASGYVLSDMNDPLNPVMFQTTTGAFFTGNTILGNPTKISIQSVSAGGLSARSQTVVVVAY